MAMVRQEYTQCPNFFFFFSVFQCFHAMENDDDNVLMLFFYIYIYIYFIVKLEEKRFVFLRLHCENVGKYIKKSFV